MQEQSTAMMKGRRKSDLARSMKIATAKLRAADHASRGGVSVGNTRQLIAWVNDFLQLTTAAEDDDKKGNQKGADKSKGFKKLSDFGQGNHACQILDACTRGEALKMQRVRFGANITDQERLSNWKEFQRCLDKLKVRRASVDFLAALCCSIAAN